MVYRSRVCREPQVISLQGTVFRQKVGEDNVLPLSHPETKTDLGSAEWLRGLDKPESDARPGIAVVEFEDQVVLVGC